MTDIEAKALELATEALARAIEQHEAFKQEVSDAVLELGCWPGTVDLERFIIPKPDPLVEVLKDTYPDVSIADEDAKYFRAALAKRGLEIVEKKQ